MYNIYKIDLKNIRAQLLIILLLNIFSLDSSGYSSEPKEGSKFSFILSKNLSEK